jgi:GT2 family glycosyltransferase
LEQCLASVYESVKNVEAEIFVVDNNSVDHSVKMIKSKYPEVRLIVNTENAGFAKANNQAIKQSTGEYVLLLNPDTVVEADTFEKVIAFMDHTPDAGGLGVKMVNGRGEFLPESKRSLPVPSVAFYKIFGLSKIFKHSKRFGKYHLTYLPEDEINAVDVLSGAFMFLRRSVLDRVGWLDEDYFMYGEDIDLSYRIAQAGYKNYYFPQTRIIHYKGESTKKTSINYVLVFYEAMRIFAQKHFTHTHAWLFGAILHAAIWIRTCLAIMKRLLLSILVPLADWVLIYAGLLIIALHWHEAAYSDSAGTFPDVYLYRMLPVYALVWVCSVFFLHGYKKPVNTERVNLGIVVGMLAILLVYALLDEHLRFSRAVLVLGTAWSFLITNVLRYAIGKLKIKSYPVGKFHAHRILILGDSEEVQRVAALMSITTYKSDFVAFVHHVPQNTDSSVFIGHIGQIKDIISIYRIGVLIFCAKNLTTKEIIDTMGRLQSANMEFKIAPPESSYVIGSNSTNISGDMYLWNLNSISSVENRNKKRVLDVTVSWVLFLTLPLNIWFVRNRRMFLRNLFLCFTGKKTWVGYCPLKNSDHNPLPDLRKGVLFTTDRIDLQQFDEAIIGQINCQYAKDYRWWNDVLLIGKRFKHLGR